MKKKPPKKDLVYLSGEIQIDPWKVVSEAVEVGVRYGYHRAHKHTDSPGEDMICDEIEMAVMNELAERIIWPE